MQQITSKSLTRENYFFSALLGLVLGSAVLLYSSKAIIVVLALVILFFIAYLPVLAFLCIIAVIPFSLELFSGLTIAKLVGVGCFLILLANAALGRCQWPIFFKRPEALVALLVFALGFASVLVADDLKSAFKESLESVLYAIIFLVTITYIKTLDDFKKVIWVLLIVGTLQGFLSIAQVHFGVIFTESWRASQNYQQYVGLGGLRAETTTAHPILLAIYFQTVMPFVAFMLFQAKANSQRILYGLLLMLMLYGWYLTYARSSAIGILVMLFLALALFTNSGRKIAFFVLLVVSFAMLLAISNLQQADQVVSEVWSVGISNSLVDSLRFRFESWAGGWNLFMDNLLFGVGYGQAVNHYLPYLPAWTVTNHHPLAIHNAFLQVGAERGGMLALSLYLLLWLMAIRALVSLFNDQRLGIYAKLLLVILGGQFIMLMVTPMVRETWLVFGLCFALYRIASDETNWRQQVLR